MITTKGISEKRVSKYLSFGSNQVLKINDIELTAFGNGIKKVTYHMESKPINSPGFEPEKGSQGQVGRVVAASYLKDERSEHLFVMEDLLTVALALGVREQLDEVQADNLADYINKAKPVLCGKFARWLVGAKEYASADGSRIKFNLVLPKYRYVESLEVPEGESKLPPFDKNSSFHYKKLPTKEVDGFDKKEKRSDDLPF